MKTCYFLQTHQNPQQIYRLTQIIKKLSPNAQVLIGHDFTNCPLDVNLFQHLSDVHLIKINRPGIRGEFSLLAPYLQAIDWLFANKSDFSWLFYLSGQDYPTQPLSNVESFLANTDYDGFIHYCNLLSPESPWEKDEVIKRYYSQHYYLPNWVRWVQRNLKKVFKRIAPTGTTVNETHLNDNSLPIKALNIKKFTSISLPAKKTPFNDKFLCYGGSQWHTLSRKCIEYIRDFIENNPNFVKYYKKTLVPDESFIQTILINNQNFKFCNDNKRYIDFTEADSDRPRVLTSQDYDTITNGSFHFARKFEQDTRILDMLEANMLVSL